MWGRLRSSARSTLQRAVSEVVDDAIRRDRQQSENRHDQILMELTATSGELRRVINELAEARSQVATVRERLDELEQCVRRDIAHALDIGATADAASFVLEHLPTATVCRHPHETLRFALSLVDGDGMALEFGVATGTTLAIIAEQLRPAGRTVVGFDVFTGLPEAWRSGFPAGEFAQPAPPTVPGAELVVGLFEDTLPGFLADHSGPVAFAHLDADLYSSTATVLREIGDRLRPGSVLLFDEFFNYPGWQRHEYRAWTEFVERTGLGFEYLAYTGDHEQVVVRVTG